MEIFMKKNWKTLLLFIAIPLIVGALAALITGGGMSDFAALNQPPLSPPAWLFPVAWTILYTLMGISSYLVYISDAPSGEIRSALTLYGIQLVINFLWPIFFFEFGMYLFSFVWLLLLWVMVLWTLISFFRISKPAGWLMIPYLAWLTFAAYLNLAIYLLN